MDRISEAEFTEASAPKRFRFSLAVLLVAVACIGTLLAWVESRSRENFVSEVATTHLVPLDQSETKMRLEAWLLSHGFEPTDRAQQARFPFSADDRELERASYYSGHWRDSGLLFICTDPNRWGGETELDQYLSNVSFQVYGDYPIRVWQTGHQEGQIRSLVSAFHDWADQFGPVPTAIEQLDLPPEKMAKALSRKHLLHRDTNSIPTRVPNQQSLPDR